MKWEKYSKKFELNAKLKDYKDPYIKICLTYAKKLFDNKLPVIFNGEHFSFLVGYNELYLRKVSNSPSNFYREYKIPKKSKGKFRKINEPLPNLKNIQKWILSEILNHIKVSDYAKAFQKNKNIIDNAKFHRGQAKVMTIDLKDYFGTIRFKQVYPIFLEFGYAKDVAVLLTNLCLLNGSLPQGSPTSPAISNIVSRNLDKRIASYCKKNKIRYTRYADDLTFSGDFSEGKLYNFVQTIINSEGFTINKNKTRVRKRFQQQNVTGIVVNEKLQTSKKYRREVRKDLYYINRYGLDSHLNFKYGNKKPQYENYIRELLGKVDFILQVNPLDEQAKMYKAYLLKLL